MKGDAKVIDYLNKGLRSELTAINQYWLHYRLLEDWGYNELAKKWREESIEEMHHADKFVDRLIFLEGFPNMQVFEPLMTDEEHHIDFLETQLDLVEKLGLQLYTQAHIGKPEKGDAE